MQLPLSLSKLIESFERLPGIGPKSAQRLTFYLLHVPQHELDRFADNLHALREKTIICSVCFNVGEVDPCEICSSLQRDHSTICVTEQPLDVLAIERAGAYKGLYHVLHGSISPLNNIGPDEIHLRELFPRLKNGEVTEVILATNPNMEGEATAMYIMNQISQLRQGFVGQAKLKITRIARGLPTGSDIEYADEVSLNKAFEGRREF
jgi:recombination protein RecR